MWSMLSSYPIKSYKKDNLKIINPKKTPYNKKKVFILLAVIGLVIIIFLGNFFWNDEARIERALENHETSEYQATKILIQDLLKENPKDPFALKAQGKYYLMIALEKNLDVLEESNLLKKSIASFEKIVILGNGQSQGIKSDLYFFMGLAYFLIGRRGYEHSLYYLERSVELDQKDQEVTDYVQENGLHIHMDNKSYSISLYGLLGLVSYQLNESDRTISYLNKAVKEKDAVVIYHYYLGLAYKDLGIYEKALEELEIVINKEKDTILLEKSYFKISSIYLLKKEYNQSIRYIKKAQKLYLSPPADSYYRLGLVYEAKKQNAKAIKYWRKAVQLNKKHSKAWRKLVRYEQKFKKPSRKSRKKRR